MRNLLFRLKELETSIRSQVAAEERAHKIVQRLVLEDEITRDILITSVSLVELQGKVGRIRGRGEVRLQGRDEIFDFLS